MKCNKTRNTYANEANKVCKNKNNNNKKKQQQQQQHQLKWINKNCILRNTWKII